MEYRTFDLIFFKTFNKPFDQCGIVYQPMDKKRTMANELSIIEYDYVNSGGRGYVINPLKTRIREHTGYVYRIRYVGFDDGNDDLDNVIRSTPIFRNRLPSKVCFRPVKTYPSVQFVLYILRKMNKITGEYPKMTCAELYTKRGITFTDALIYDVPGRLIDNDGDSTSSRDKFTELELSDP